MSALLLHARRHHWQFFSSFTYKNTRTMGGSVRYKMQFQLMREVCHSLDYPFAKLEFLIREELGEATERLHWHCLFSGLPPSTENKSTCFLMMNTWEKIGGGMARVHVFNPRLSGADYVLKGLEKANAANSYELSKFNESGTLKLIPAHRLLRQWGEWLETNRRHRKARDMRRASRRDPVNRGSAGNGYEMPQGFPHPADEVRLYC